MTATNRTDFSGTDLAQLFAAEIRRKRGVGKIFGLRIRTSLFDDENMPNTAFAEGKVCRNSSPFMPLYSTTSIRIAVFLKRSLHNFTRRRSCCVMRSLRDINNCLADLVEIGSNSFGNTHYRSGQ